MVACPIPLTIPMVPAVVLAKTTFPTGLCYGCCPFFQFKMFRRDFYSNEGVQFLQKNSNFNAIFLIDCG